MITPELKASIREEVEAYIAVNSVEDYTDEDGKADGVAIDSVLSNLTDDDYLGVDGDDIEQIAVVEQEVVNTFAELLKV